MSYTQHYALFTLLQKKLGPSIKIDNFILLLVVIVLDTKFFVYVIG